MFVKKILNELDAELQRLQVARDTIVSLITGPSVKKRAPSLKTKPPAPAQAPTLPLETAPLQDAGPLTEQASEIPVQVFPARRRGRPKGSRNQGVRDSNPRVSKGSRLNEPTALGRAVSAGPVFVSAAELEQRRKQPMEIRAPKVPEIKPAEGTLDSLVREIAARRVEAAA